MIEWSVHPFKRNYLKSAILLIFLIIVLLLVYILYQSLTLVIVASGLLFISLLKFFSVTWYRLTDDGITIITPFGTTTKRWTDYQSFWPDKNGVLLSPFSEKSRLENFRGVYLLFNNNSETVIEFIKQKIKNNVEQRA